MHVLITNDDGVDSPGIHTLARTARELGLSVTVAAPSWDSSGASASLTAVERDGRVVIDGRSIDDLDATGFAIEAAPAFIARLGATGGLGPKPDLVLSGINHGANTGQAVLHSGTVGAALTASTYGLPSVAFSLDDRGTLHWVTAAAIARQPDAETEPGTNAALLAAGYASYTPLRTVCEATTLDLGDHPPTWPSPQVRQAESG